MTSPPDVVCRVALEVQRYWGAHLYVRVLESTEPCMDWFEVRLPASCAEWSAAQVTTVLLHEWGHRMISPVSPVRGACWRRVARKKGLTEAQAALLVNIAADGWVDRAYLANPDWAQRFTEGGKEILREAISRLSPPSARDQLGPDDLARVWIGLNLRLHERARQRLAGTAAGRADPSKLPPVELSAPQAAKVEEIWDILYEGSAGPEQRIAKLAAALLPLLPLDGGYPVLLSPLHGLTGRERNGRGLTGTIVRAAGAGGLSDEDLEAIAGRAALDALKRQARRLEMYARIVPAVVRFMKSRRHLRFSGYRTWGVGDPIRTLDVRATLERGGVLIPNVSTLARRLEHRGATHGRGGSPVILVVDDSGSTEGAVLEREKEAALAVIAAARCFGDPVGCIVFGSGVTGSIPPTSRYAEVEDALCALASDSGGTEIVPALRRALEWAAESRGAAVMVMTDSEAADAANASTVVRAFPSSVTLTAFCFSDPDTVRERFGAWTRRRARVFAASADRPFAETALEAVYG